MKPIKKNVLEQARHYTHAPDCTHIWQFGSLCRAMIDQTEHLACHYWSADTTMSPESPIGHSLQLALCAGGKAASGEQGQISRL